MHTLAEVWEFKCRGRQIGVTGGKPGQETGWEETRVPSPRTLGPAGEFWMAGWQKEKQTHLAKQGRGVFKGVVCGVFRAVMP